MTPVRRSRSGLGSVDVRPLLNRSRRQAIRQFRRAAANVPFYRRLLSKRGVRASRVTSLESFQDFVPVITKQDVFGHPLAHLLANGSFDDVETLISSSGHTAQSFSLGLIGRRSAASMVRSTDELLEYWFGVTTTRTFVINTCAMGVKVPTSLPGIDLSVRSDKAVAILRAMRPYFRQFIVVSDVYFLKKILEEGSPDDWKRRRTHFVIGGEWFPETYRTYLGHLLQVDLEDRRPRSCILSSMGAAELGFSLCFETHDTVRLRRLAMSDPRLCEALFGPVDTVPLIGHYDPRRWFIELAKDNEVGRDGGLFVFTNVDAASAMPLIRYQTGDSGFLLSHSRVSEVLKEFGYTAWLPALKMPLIAVAGRTGQSVKAGAHSVRVEHLRALLYADHRLAAQTTGQFQVEENGRCLKVHIQLKPHVEGRAVDAARTRFSSVINEHVAADVSAVPYFDFRHGMAIDYERKFQHVTRENHVSTVSR